MLRTVWFRGVILVLLLGLIVPPAFAAGDREPAGPSVRGVLSALWQAFVELIPVVDRGSEIVVPESAGLTDSGPGMDPNG